VLATTERVSHLRDEIPRGSHAVEDKTQNNRGAAGGSFGKGKKGIGGI